MHLDAMNGNRERNNSCYQIAMCHQGFDTAANVIGLLFWHAAHSLNNTVGLALHRLAGLNSSERGIILIR